MKPTVTIGDCQLYLGDCLEIMPHLPKVDAVVTDPPYGIGESRNKRGGTHYGASAAPSKDYGVFDWDDRPASREQIIAILASAKKQVIWGGNYFHLPPSSCWLVWDKQTGGNGYADFEMAWTNLTGACRKIVWRWMGMLQADMKNKEERVHPTQKPIEVMRWCLNLIPSAQTILDPFMGSGTTGVACAKLGRKFIGIEIEEKYFDIACKRIEEAYKQPDFFIEEKKAEQLLLKETQ